MIEFLIANWYIIIALIGVVIVIATCIYKFIGLPTKEQIIKIKMWLLQAVILAEKELGSGTGQLKLSVVYDKFMSKFPNTAKIITFEMFSELVDKALDEMKELFDTNDQIKAIGENKQ